MWATNNWISKNKIVLLLLLLCFFLSGCWDRNEIEERATVLAVAIDEVDPELGEKEEENVSHLTTEGLPEEMLRITVQIAVPGRLPLGTGGGGVGGEGGAASVWVIHAVGHTFDDAWHNLQQQLSQELFLGHLRIIVISEAYARRGLRDINDFLRRQTDVRRAAWLVISKEKAESYMKAVPQIERIPTMFLVNAIDSAVRIGRFPEEFLGIFWSKLSSLGQEPFLPYVTLKEKENMEISGMAYFLGDKMIDILAPLQIGYYMAILQINPSGYGALIGLPDENAHVMYRSTQRKSKISVEIKEGRPHVKVAIHVEGDIREKQNQKFEVRDPTVIDKIEKEVEKKGTEGMKKLIKQTQEHGSDIFGFGEFVRAKHSHYWNEQIKSSEKWQEMYKEIVIEIDLTAKVRRVGMKAK